ncbi:MAG: hypothetical protein NZ608_07110 [candidate division WOR-3 bacterium]|nr:hypothetical protein [candidate division WOR-3 bacterium]
MRTLIFILLGIFILLLAYFYINYRDFFTQINKEEINAEMLSKKVIELYEEKLNRLKSKVDSLENLTKLRKKEIAEIRLLKEEIKKGEELLADLKRAEEEKRHELYRLCIEIYQKARGRCEILREKAK